MNVNKRVCRERNQQTFANADDKRWHFFKRFVNFVLNSFPFRANSKFQLFRAAVSKIHSQTVTTKKKA